MCHPSVVFAVGDSVTMRQNAATLIEIFGTEVLKSCLVLLTKTAPNPSKLTSYQNVCSSLGCPFVLWESNHVDECTEQWVNLEKPVFEKQKRELFGTVRALPKFHMSNLQAMKDEIMRRAAVLRENQPVKYETVISVIDVPYVEQASLFLFP